MKIKQIKEKANTLLIDSKARVIHIFIIVAILEMITGFFSNGNGIFSSFLSGIITILTITFSHAYVVVRLKVARQDTVSLSDDDALVGIKHFKEIFPTYLLSKVVSWGILFLCALIPSMILIFSLGGVSYYSFADTSGSFKLMAILFILLMAVIAVIVDAYLFSVPYLLAEYNMKTSQALKTSYALMKGHVKEFFVLKISFIGYFLIEIVLMAIAFAFLSVIPFIGNMIASLLIGIIMVYIYKPYYYSYFSCVL